MSTFTGLRISRFFLSLRTSALFPFLCSIRPRISRPSFLLQLLQISGKNPVALTYFRQIAKIQRWKHELLDPSQEIFLSISSCCGFGGVVVVNKEVSQGVDGVVVKTVFLRELARSVGGFRVMIAFHCLNQAGASRRDD